MNCEFHVRVCHPASAIVRHRVRSHLNPRRPRPCTVCSVSDSSDHIRYENPFATPLRLREPSRRLRGRIVAPVTVWTSGRAPDATGLTISSLLVAEGPPAIVFGIMNQTADLWEAIHDTRAFVVHVLEEPHRALAERFAGLRPSPGGLFTGLEVKDSEWGPELTALGTRAYCRYSESTEAGLQHLVRGEIERTELTDIELPLGYFRGRYRSLRALGRASPIP
jgi:3-hydroxy-9,10-secoandrosta-1,3,5(10)-triene-9,17-dione monooxygenase reductase component